MVKPYSLDLRERAIAWAGVGESVRYVAAGLCVSAANAV
jgi:transposase